MVVCACVCVFLEQVSARIVQEVTAEAVAVLKGEQESQRLPSGKQAYTHVFTHTAMVEVSNTTK